MWHLNHRRDRRAPKRLIINTLDFVSEGDGTGLAVSLSCYYGSADIDTPVPLLTSIGAFTVRGQGFVSDSGCPDRVEPPDPLHPLLKILTADDLSGWGCSIHEGIDSMPVGYDAVAQHRESDLSVHRRGNGA